MGLPRDSVLAAENGPDTHRRFKDRLASDPTVAHVILLVSKGRGTHNFPHGAAEAVLMID
jgi:hypothetical protein